jgi:hypothetical protein
MIDLSPFEEEVMLKIKPEFWTKSGGERFVILSLDDFEKVQELIEDAGLSRILREAKRKEAHSATISLAEMKKRITPAVRRRARTR